jgi:formyltetrahydrofolate-dependent phosphoribosylglycinamide formyltransferase
MDRAPIKLAVLISGSGTTLQNLADCIRARSLNAKIAAVVASRADIKGIDRAREAGLPLHLVERTKYPDIAAFSRDIFKICTDADVELICLGGWLSLLDIPDAFVNRIMNIHPALLPSFGGTGMYGKRVHQTVLDHGCKVSGCTVHFVDRVYDNGPIILQRTCPVMEDDTPETLAHRVFEEEKIAYPRAIQLFQENRLRVDGRRVRII